MEKPKFIYLVNYQLDGESEDPEVVRLTTPITTTTCLERIKNEIKAMPNHEFFHVEIQNVSYLGCHYIES